MKIETIPIADLIPYARNSRTHSDQQVAQVAASIREFGFTNPVLIDAEDGIIAGHGRVMAARKLNMTEVPCIRLEHLTETQKKAYIIADNKLALNSGWDEEMLGLELAELREVDFDLVWLALTTLQLSSSLTHQSAMTKRRNHPAARSTWTECKWNVPVQSADLSLTLRSHEDSRLFMESDRPSIGVAERHQGHVYICLWRWQLNGLQAGRV